MNAIADILKISQDILWLNFIVFLRVGPVMSLFPGFGERSVPARIKLMVALMFTLVVTPAVAPLVSETVRQPPPFAWLVLSETAIGLDDRDWDKVVSAGAANGWINRGPSDIACADSGQRGRDTPLPAIGHLLVVGGLALAMMLGLHVQSR